MSGHSRQREQQMLRIRGNHSQVTKDQVWFLETTEDPIVWTEHFGLDESSCEAVLDIVGCLATLASTY